MTDKMPNPSQNKKSRNQPHKPTQIAAHFILPNRTQAHPTLDCKLWITFGGQMTSVDIKVSNFTD